MFLGERLKKLRKNQGESIREVAKELGVNKNTLSRYERNDRSPKADFINKAANYYNVTTDYLFGRSDYKNLEAKIKTLIQEETIEYLDQEDMKFINALAQDEQRQALMKTTQDMEKKDLERFIRMAKAFEEKKIE